MTDKQQIAVESYCLKSIINREKGYSWSQAMRDAGYKEGYIDKNAHLLRDKLEIKEKIEAEKAKFRKRIGLEAEDVIGELTVVAFSNIKDYLKVNEKGDVFLRGFKGIEQSKLAAIESIKVNTTRNKDDSREYTTTQFKLHSKLNALEQLCKHLGLYRELGPNAEKEAIKRASMSAEEVKLAEAAAKLRTDEESGEVVKIGPHRAAGGA